MSNRERPGEGERGFSGQPRTEGGPLSENLRRMVADLVLDTTAEGIWLINADARTTFVNRRIAELLGYTEDEMLGRPIFDFLDRQRWPIAEHNLQQRALGVEERQEVQLVRKDGTLLWVLASANPVFDAAGNYAGALALLGDLSPQKEKEDLLRAQIDVLRSRLASSRSSGPAVSAAEPPGYREPFRTAIVLGVLGTFVATVGLVTVGGLGEQPAATPSRAG